MPISPGQQATLVASAESWETMLRCAPAEVDRLRAERRQALLQIAVPASPSGDACRPSWCWPPTSSSSRRPAACEDAARAHAAGDEVRTVIAGYHWFTDWGRDTMISLEGLTLTTGRAREAGCILRTFAHYVRDGLIPNMFPEGENEGLYHTADATLWFFHAIDRYLARHRRPRRRCDCSCRSSIDIVEHHMRGHAVRHRRRSGATACCARAQRAISSPGWTPRSDDWVVTPRRGKAVEINALWYNALRLLEGWLRREAAMRGAASRIARRAERARESFNRALLVRGRRLSVRRGRRRERRRRLPAGPTRSSPSRSTIRSSTDRAGSRCWTW